MTSKRTSLTGFAAERFAASFAGYFYGYSYSYRAEIA